MTSQSGGMHNLTTLIKRLEAATSRLEDIAVSTSPYQVPAQAQHAASSAAPSPAIMAVQSSPAPPQAKEPEPESAADDLPASILEFDQILQDDLSVFERMSKQIGGLVAEQGTAFAEAFRAQRNILLIASKAKEPSQQAPVYQEIIADLSKRIMQVQEIREANRKCSQDNHLAMLAEGVGLLAWVQIKPRPDEYVGELLGGAQMYGNRILKEFKETDAAQVDWVRAFVKSCGSLKSYIKENHSRGLQWNIHGVPAEQVLEQLRSNAPSAATPAAAAATGTAPPPPAGGPPPPPPPPLPPALEIQNPQQAAGGDMGAVFADLNRGESVTSGLKKVDKSQMTHKNPSLRTQSSTAQTARGKSPAPGRKPDTLRTKKPPRKDFESNKWMIENYDQSDLPAGTPIEINAEKQHSILVSRCKNVTIRVNGKANAISIDNCSRVDLLVDSLVSALDVINTSNFRAQVLGTLPSVQLDKVDSGTVFLSQDSLDCQIFTSKCSSINITLPPVSESDDSVECPVPEQIRSWVENGQVLSEIVKQEG